MKFYRAITGVSAPVLSALLALRLRAGKEDPARLDERKGIASLPRPDGLLYWVHAASVGEAQSALILIDALLNDNPRLTVMVTTGTVTSAEMMARRLPPRAFHQFYPLDHPAWVARFLDYWKPAMAFWMESELWPNMLGEVKSRFIPAALVNARMSKRSFANWDKARRLIADILGAFSIVLAQSQEDGFAYRALGARHVVVTDNLKFSAAPLPADAQNLRSLEAATQARPLWVYASTHAGEETLACHVHSALKNAIPGLLTIIVPRHPHRRDEIAGVCSAENMKFTMRGDTHILPSRDDDIYVVDTMGELGALYRLSSIAMVGRSFSNDGGGGHNLIEPAQLGCAVLTGPHVQNQQKVFDEMDIADAIRQVHTEAELTQALLELFQQPDMREAAINRARQYAAKKAGVLERVMETLSPIVQGAARQQEAV